MVTISYIKTILLRTVHKFFISCQFQLELFIHKLNNFGKLCGHACVKLMDWHPVLTMLQWWGCDLSVHFCAKWFNAGKDQVLS